MPWLICLASAASRSRDTGGGGERGREGEREREREKKQCIRYNIIIISKAAAWLHQYVYTGSRPKSDKYYIIQIEEGLVATNRCVLISSYMYMYLVLPSPGR